MKKLPLTATIVARNEESRIRKCLSSISNLADEILFVHDGSCDDRTIDIAKEFTNKIFIRRFVGEAEPHRKFIMSKASNDWILQIDADEYLTPGFAGSLKGLLNNKTISGYLFKWNIAPKGEPKRYQYKLALYKKSRITKFDGIPHETVSLRGPTTTLREIELGHDRRINKEKLKHKMQVWPTVQGKYMAKYKYSKVPIIVLPLGYAVYPLLTSLIRIVKREDKTLREMLTTVKYSFVCWNSLFVNRVKMARRRK